MVCITERGKKLSNQWLSLTNVYFTYVVCFDILHTTPTTFCYLHGNIFYARLLNVPYKIIYQQLAPF